VFLLGTEIPSRVDAKSHQMSGDLDWLVGCNKSLERVHKRLATGNSNEGFCECLLTQWIALGKTLTPMVFAWGRSGRVDRFAVIRKRRER